MVKHRFFLRLAVCLLLTHGFTCRARAFALLFLWREARLFTGRGAFHLNALEQGSSLGQLCRTDLQHFAAACHDEIGISLLHGELELCLLHGNHQLVRQLTLDGDRFHIRELFCNPSGRLLCFA